MKKRREERVKKFSMGKVVLASGDTIAYTQNLSISGACFASNQEITIGEQIVVMLSASGLSDIQVNGLVVWKKDQPDSSKTKYKYGIALTEVSKDYEEVIENIMEQGRERE